MNFTALTNDQLRELSDASLRHRLFIVALTNLGILSIKGYMVPNIIFNRKYINHLLTGEPLWR